MIQFQDSKFGSSEELPIMVGATVTAEGQALVADYTGGVFGVKPSAGAAGEQFVGVSLSQQLTILYLPYVERLTVAALAVTTSFTPAAGTIRVYNVTRAAAVAAGAGAGQYGISGAVITVVTGGATVNTDVLEVSYRYSPSTVQARAVQGDIPAGGSAALTLGTTGVVTSGTIVNSEFDTSVDWSANPTTVKLAAGGLFTVGGSGINVPNCHVTQVPSASNPFLGLRFSI